MTEQNIRWKHRFANYRQALDQMTRFMDKGEFNELEQQGLIKSFEHTYELAWNTLKDFLESQGESGISGPNDAYPIAFRHGLLGKNVLDGQLWLDMIACRVVSSHSYKEKYASGIIGSITDLYFDAFCKLRDTLDAYIDDA